MLENRLANLRRVIERKGLDALFVTDPVNIFYLSGLYLIDWGEFCAGVFVTASEEHVLVDPRYTAQARRDCSRARVHEYSGRSFVKAAAEMLNELGAARVGFEADHVTVDAFRKIRSETDSGVALRATREIVRNLRQVKDAGEIALIRTAAALADAAYEAVMLEIALGMKETEVALAIDVALRKMGADKEAFPTIAAAGPNSALPHAIPGSDVLKPGQFLIMDFGARLAGYNSDITRTVCIGKPSARQRKVYQTVLDAQLRAIDAIAPGKTGHEIDAVARDYIDSQGFAGLFGHGLGHGLGIHYHDHPALSSTSKLVLEPGMVVTVEPGVYIEGWGGVRIEDDVVVTNEGVEVLTKAGKVLTVI